MAICLVNITIKLDVHLVLLNCVQEVLLLEVAIVYFAGAHTVSGSVRHYVTLALRVSY